MTNAPLSGAIVEYQLHCCQELKWSDKYTGDRSYSGVTNTLLIGTIVE